MKKSSELRLLAAIRAADVVGYSRLMGADEVGTLKRLKAHGRELIDPAIAGHRGRIVKTTGDYGGTASRRAQLQALEWQREPIPNIAGGLQKLYREVYMPAAKKAGLPE